MNILIKFLKTGTKIYTQPSSGPSGAPVHLLKNIFLNTSLIDYSLIVQEPYKQ